MCVYVMLTAAAAADTLPDEVVPSADVDDK